MKTNKVVTILFACTLLISACGTDAAATPASTDEAIPIEQAYTAAAMTVVSQFNQTAQATSTPLPASTPTLFPTVTLIGINSLPTATLFQTILNTSSSAATGCDNSVYLSDVTIPDGTTLTPGESFTKTWSLQNTGSCAWTTAYAITYYSGNSMSGSATVLTDAVSSGGSINVSVDLVAPSTAGTYTGYWRLQNASSVSFGEAVYVQIVVSGSTVTPTATDGDESYTSTPTTEATSTKTPTPTTAPTSAPTATPVPTSVVEPTTVETASS
jgi:hypothetical protein